MRESYFDGGLLQLIGYRLLGGLITICTLGICAPWAFTMIYSWEAKHTVIEGERLSFDGTAIQLFGNWIKWLLLTVITFGIYGFWLGIKLKQWKVSHTHLSTGGVSHFDGGLLQLFGYCLLGFLIIICTLGICTPWAFTMVYNWEIKHTVIDGHRLCFDGTAVQLFGNWIKWFLLTFITLGIYGLWLNIKLIKWKTYHMYFAQSVFRGDPFAEFPGTNNGTNNGTGSTDSLEYETHSGILKYVVALGAVILILLVAFLFGSKALELIKESSNTPDPVDMSHISDVSVSSFFVGKKTYPGENTIDGDWATSWQEGVDGYGEGESIEFTFDDVYRMKGITIVPGNQKRTELFYQNGRPRQITLEFADGERQTLDLDDNLGIQHIEFDDFIDSDSIKIIIDSVYEGTKYEDTCITEIKFY